jgi:DNA-binding MarR family transcriptional regulator
MVEMQFTRTQNITTLNQLVQDNGNNNVLLVHAIAERVGLSATEFECWSLIADTGPMTVGELAKRCHITSGGMTGMVDRLERGGFVQRDADPSDRRRVLVRAADKSPELSRTLHKVQAMYAPMQQQFDALLSEFSDEQVAFLVTFMTQANAMFRSTLDALPEK